LKRIESIVVVGKEKSGDVGELRKRIGEKNFDYLIKKELIYQGKYYPNLWRITDKGKKRSSALKNKWSRMIATIFWRLHLI